MRRKWHFQCLKLLKNAKFPLLYHMVYGKKDLDLLDILIYKFMHILKIGGSCCFVLAVGSAAGRNSVKCSAIF